MDAVPLMGNAEVTAFPNFHNVFVLAPTTATLYSALDIQSLSVLQQETVVVLQSQEWT